MVRSILREIEKPGTGKTQTRRVLNPQPNAMNGGLPLNNGRGAYSTAAGWKRYPITKGDLLWVREACATWTGSHRDVVYRADETAEGWSNLQHDARLGLWKIRSSIHMPRWAARLTLEVTGVRVQRLQDISEEDALAEGCEAHPFPGPWWQGYMDVDGEMIHQQAVGDKPPDWMIEPKRMRDMSHLDRSARSEFKAWWNGLNAGRGFGWDVNPWVCAVTFIPHLMNVDELLRQREAA